jgi:hypothetical protein
MENQRSLYIRLKVPSLDPDWCEWEELPAEGMPPICSAQDIEYIRPTLDTLCASGARSMQFVGDFYSVEYSYDPNEVVDAPEPVEV